MSQNHIRTLLSAHPVIPVVTFQSLDEVEPMIRRLLLKGIRCIEITLRTTCALDAMKKAKREFSTEMSVGMGTITQKNHIRQAIDLGLDFMVSPGIGKHLIEAFQQSDIPYLPGVATPGEIILGLDYGCDTFKFFPAHLFGGIEAVKTYAQVFPEIKFCPTGGITAASYQDYLSLSNVISVGGSWMTKGD